jgi:glycosyltransferase involved in cell wall biosynthesis
MSHAAQGSEHLFLGTFPPRRCGIATFTQDLVSALDGATRGFSEVIAVDDSRPGQRYAYSGRVVRRLPQTNRADYAVAALFINGHACRTLNIQHEFGIFGGDEGDSILDLMDRVGKPIILTLHTVLPAPSPSHRRLVGGLCSAAARVVVLSETARLLLMERYGIEPRRIRTIPHGIPDVSFEGTTRFKRSWGFEGRFVASTFGLLGRGKGLETAIDAVAEAARTIPEILYVILGATHPVVARNEGEAYRKELLARIRRRGIERNVLMVDRYLSLPDLLLYLGASDVYVTPYVNPDQVVSGTLAYAVGSGRPVVSTPYLYARELLAGGRGTIVPFGATGAFADALIRLATDETYRLSMARAAYDFGRGMTWPVVGQAYATILNETQSHFAR